MQDVHKKKRTLPSKFVAGFITLIVVITVASTGTLMWFTANDSVQNVMALGRQSVIVTEIFKPVDQVYPGDIVDKAVGFTNEGDMEALFRVKYDEYWTNADGDILSNIFWDSESSSVLEVMIKNWNTTSGFTNTALWTDGGDGYFYYNKLLTPGETTGSVLDSVEFNEKLLKSSVMLDYTHAQYNLTFSVDSISSSASDAAIKGHFGSYVSASVDASGNVAWTFV